MGSSNSLSAICTTRSFKVGMPRGRCFPFAFGIQCRLTGCGRYVPSLSSARSARMNTAFCSSSLRSLRLILSMPAVRLPGLLSTFSSAFPSQSSRQIKWYKSPNLCFGCIWAFRAKLSCVLRISSIRLQNVPLDCSTGFAHASLSPIFAALRLTCTLPQVLCVMVFLHLRLLWLLRHPSTTSITAYPALMQGGWLGLPRSLPNPLRRSLGFSCTPVQCRLTLSSSPAGSYLISHCRFAPCDGFSLFSAATKQLPDDFHPISIVSRMLTLWALLTEISCVALLRLRLAVWGS
jgi:hypothetical protein